MRPYAFNLLICFFVLGACPPCLPQSPDVIKSFKLSEIIQKRQASNKSWYEFINEETMFGGVYHLAKDQKDDQKPHMYDEVYYVIDGRGKLKAGDKTTTVEPGSILYVKAAVEHSFFEITEDLTVIVLFSKAVPHQADSASAFYRLRQIEQRRKPNENVWAPFLKTKTMIFGLYLLPKILGGDAVLTHQFDEINIITKGSGKFSVNNSEMPVAQGDIIFVKKGNGHYFKNLNADLDILILFEGKSLQQP